MFTAVTQVSPELTAVNLLVQLRTIVPIMERVLTQNSVNVTWVTMAQTAVTSRVKLSIRVLVITAFVCLV